jgi:2-polyprenyl-3-methyl-5-hydroxy-6-metoxy-1,4-benzoquinol methylase
MTASRTCDLCGTSSQRVRYRLGDVDVLQCTNCGLVFISNKRAAPPQKQLYNPDYFNARGEYFLQVHDQDVARLSGGHIESFRQGLKLIGQYKQGGRLLDVGCAVGIFLSLAMREGWEVSGADISEYATAAARKLCGVEIHTGEIGDLALPEASFDVITMWDVVEHFTHPRQTLQAVHRILKDDGIVLLDTPNADSLIRKVAHWIYRLSVGQAVYPVRKLYHVYHQYYFSESTLRRLLDTCGFAVVDLIFKPIPREKGRGSPMERSIVKAFGVLEGPLRMDYELLVIARKKNP